MTNNAQWAFNYTSAGLTSINFYAMTSVTYTGSLTNRAGVDGLGGKFCSTNTVSLPSDFDLHYFSISMTAADVTAVGGTNTALTLANVSQLRLMVNPAVAFAGAQMVATVSYDRISFTGPAAPPLHLDRHRHRHHGAHAHLDA